MSEEKLEGLGGWLILPIIHMFIYILIALYDLFVNAPQLSGNLISIVMFVDLILLGVYITTLVLAFNKKRLAKTFFIMSYSANIILVTLILLAFNINDSLTMAWVGGIIWIWYFSVSKRVKNTFIN